MANTKKPKKNIDYTHITIRISKELRKLFTKKLIDIEKSQTRFLIEQIESFVEKTQESGK